MVLHCTGEVKGDDLIQGGEVSNWSKGKYFLGGPVVVQLWIAWQTTLF